MLGRRQAVRMQVSGARPVATETLHLGKRIRKIERGRWRDRGRQRDRRCRGDGGCRCQGVGWHVGGCRDECHRSGIGGYGRIGWRKGSAASAARQRQH